MPWTVPVIESVVALADWLALTPSDLAWFADLRSMTHRAARPRLGHYRYHVLSKRLIEEPKRTLKLLQRQILRRILSAVPPHPSAHGFLPGRSIKTFVAPHVSRPVVLRIDLRDFFPSITRARIQAVFRIVGYPKTVAALLGGLCTNSTPHHGPMYAQPHLPQGAPTSPALANLCVWRIDCRLTGLAAAAGVQYTRYADDLAFSGDRPLERFADHVAAIVLEEGFAVNHRKTRIMRQGVRQHLAGLVTNEVANVPRVEFDRLKAILTNCVRSGLESQNRDGHPAFRQHLEGRVGFFESINPSKGKRLRMIFDRVL